jgi:lysophospholipase L1-like esterase
MDRLKTILKNIIALLLGLTLALVTLEIMLRVVEPVECRIKGNKIVLTRNRKFIFNNDKITKLDHVIYYSRNQLGFRGEAPPRDFSQTLTILTVGGSTTECTFISDGKTWPDILISKLKQEFKPVWLNNAGLDGHSTFGHLVLMEDYLIKLKPKVILFLVGANDQGLVDYSALDKKSFKNPAAPPKRSPITALAQYSEVINYAINFQKYSKAVKLGLNHSNIDFARLKLLDVPDQRLGRILEEHRDHYLKPYAQRLKRLIDEAREQGIEPVLISQPMVYGNVIDPVSGADLARVDVGGINGKAVWEILQLYNEVLRQVASQNQVLFIDLGAEMPKSSRYFYDTFHYTNEGCQLVANIIDERLAPFLAEKFPRFVIGAHKARNPHDAGITRGEVL